MPDIDDEGQQFYAYDEPEEAEGKAQNSMQPSLVPDAVSRALAAMWSHVDSAEAAFSRDSFFDYMIEYEIKKKLSTTDAGIDFDSKM